MNAPFPFRKRQARDAAHTDWIDERRREARAVVADVVHHSDHLQQAALGCKVDGGRYKIGDYTHPDAEVIAATVAGLPDSLGGKRMAIRVTELARAGLTPDWMPGAVPRCVPLEMRRNRHGDRAVSVVVGTERVLIRRKWRTVEVRACPVTFSPHPQKIESARKAYDDWWQALGWVRDGLIAGGILREVEITGVMPKARPWDPR